MRVETLRRLILEGATIRMGFAAGKRVWWIDEPWRTIDERTLREAATGHNGQPLLEECHDSLFGWSENSQTWRSVYYDGA